MTSIDSHYPFTQGRYDDSTSYASHSIAHDSGFASNVAKPNSTASNSYHSLTSHQTRRSISVLGTLPMEISALIRSHSTSSRRHRPDLHDPATEMAQEDERPTRKTKSQNRLYNFITRSLTRSRSRSQSRSGRAPPLDHNEPMPHITVPSSPASKPESRIKSRPISSTTTATNTTITPANAHTKKTLSAMPKTSPQSAGPSTPKPSSARQKIQNFFGIPSTSSKKGSGSQSTSIHQPLSDKNAPLPPLPPEATPDTSQEVDATPRPLRVLNADSRPTSPISGPFPKLPLRNGSANTSGSSNTTSSRIQKLLAGQKTPLSHSTEDVSGPIRRPSVHHRRNSSANSTSTYHSANMTAENSTSSAADIDALNQSSSVPPRIVQTPPTPSTVNGDKSLPVIPSSPSRRAHFAGEFGEVNGDKLGNLRSETTNGHRRLSTSTSGRRYSHRSTKHGSFDFERPSWSGGVISMQRSTSGGTISSESEHTAGPIHTGLRDSAMGPGLAGVGTLQREASMKRAKERDEMVAKVKEEEMLQRKALEKRGGDAEKHKHRSLQASHRTKSPDVDRGHSPGEKTGSWGKRRGAPFSHSTSSKGKLLSVGITHGAFSFEPAVPSPTWSINSTGSTREATLTSSWNGGDRVKLAREQDAAKSIKDSSRSNDGHSTRVRDTDTVTKVGSVRRSGDRAPVPVPGVNPGHRSGLKGRSLDLGLGLSWAAASIREDALLSSGFFGHAPGSPSSQSGHSTVARRDKVEEEDESRPIGPEVAAMFKNVLNEQSYARFIAYVDQWDAKQIGFDGPKGIVTQTDDLLSKVPNLTEDARKQLLSKFIKLILRNM